MEPTLKQIRIGTLESRWECIERTLHVYTWQRLTHFLQTSVHGVATYT